MTFFKRLRDWRRRGRAIRELRSLPPEILADIGIERGTEGDVASALLAQQNEMRPRPDMLLHKAAMFQRVDLPAAPCPGR